MLALHVNKGFQICRTTTNKMATIEPSKIKSTDYKKKSMKFKIGSNGKSWITEGIEGQF